MPRLKLLILALALAGFCRAAGPAPVPAAGAPTLKGARDLMAAGKLDEAAAAYEALGPQKSPRTEGWRLNNWGLSLLLKDKAGDAAPLLEKAVAADSKNFTAWANLAAAYEKIGDKVKASDTFRRAIELLRAENSALASGKKGRDAETVANAAPLSASAESLDEAPSKLKSEALAAALKQAATLMEQSKFQEAADAYAQIGMTSPAKREGWRLNNWGLAYIRLGDYSKALTRLKKSVEVFPDNPKAWNNLGVAYENLGQSQQAKDAYTRASSTGQAADLDAAKVELNHLKLDFNAEKKKWEASR